MEEEYIRDTEKLGKSWCIFKVTLFVRHPGVLSKARPMTLRAEGEATGHPYGPLWGLSGRRFKSLWDFDIRTSNSTAWSFLGKKNVWTMELAEVSINH